MMKKISLTTVLLLMMTGVGLWWGNSVYADTSNFYFSDFTGDYYLTEDADGVSHLKVVEKVVAEFPNYNQNKGICRYIPFTNQDDENITLPSLTRSDIVIKRNDITEPIYSIKKEGNFYNVCTGTDDYVTGTQVYTFEYEFQRVVTDFRDYQELYWDANGNGSLQKFEKVTARLHFENPEYYTGESSCYVGVYGGNGQSRCTITQTEDGVSFVAKELRPKETLTFVVKLEPGSFAVLAPFKENTLIWFLVTLVVICAICIVLALVKYLRSREKNVYYKSLFVKPEYQPHPDYSLPEMAELYTGKKKDAKVAMLLELTVDKKIQLKKGDKKKWSIIVNNLEGVENEYIDLLSILNAGVKPHAGTEIEVKQRAANATLVSLRNTMQKKVEKDLEEDGLATDKWKYGITSSYIGVGTVIVDAFFSLLVLLPICGMVISFLQDAFSVSDFGKWMKLYDVFFAVSGIIIMATTVVVVWLLLEARKYRAYTFKGLKMARYMDGLRLYIEMAEADRLKLLQSVKGADTSAEGIVKLYEKLLPYAAVFGLEESWMNEMKNYCKVEDIAEPDYLMTGLMVHDISRSFTEVAGVATASSIMSSSGGGSSSGFSGGGGGGFSGGGGGGGGFGGR